MNPLALVLSLTLLMPDSVSQIAALRDWVTTTLQASADFAGVTVVSRKVGNLQNAILRSLEKDKLVVIVNVPLANTQPRQTQRPVLDPVTIIVRCVENVLLNKSGKSALYLAERTVAALQWKRANVTGGDLIQPVDPAIRQLLITTSKAEEESEEDPDYDGWDVTFQTKLALTPAS